MGRVTRVVLRDPPERGDGGGQDDRGIVTAWTAGVALSCLMLTGLVIDSGLALRHRSEAFGTAAAAARAGAQALDEAAMLTRDDHSRPVLDQAGAEAAVQDFLAAERLDEAGFTAEVSFPAQDEITVTIRGTTDLYLLPVEPTVEVDATAVAVQTNLSGAGGASAEALADIPSDLLALYQAAGEEYGIDWTVLAGIGKTECDHGRYEAAGCNPPGTVNDAGARGPMQFVGDTWRGDADRHDTDVAGPPVPEGAEAQGFATDGDGEADPWDAADAIYAAARYLRHHGAPGDYRGAVFAYNHSQAYVNEVMTWADIYRAPPVDGGGTGTIPDPGGGVELATVRGITVHTAIAQPLDRMLAAAERDGVRLTGWGYRSAQRQIELRRQNCGTSDYAVYEMPSSQCSPPTARPGASNHERGLAVDFENCSSRSTACYQWLASNAATYGFYNLPSEPWHWSIDGR